MDVNDVVILGGARTAIGTFGGSLKDKSAIELGTAVVKEAIKRARVEPDDVGHVVMGNVLPAGPEDVYLARACGLGAGIPETVPAFNVNRLCGSGVQAIISAAQSIMLGDVACAIAGGAETMTRVPYLLPSNRWGARMGDAKVIDFLVSALNDPFGNGHMGCTAENIAARYGISREEQDALAVEGHRRAIHAIQEGYFKEQIVPIEIKGRKGTALFEIDEHARADVDIESVGKMKPAFRQGGSVTAANSSGLNDAAAAVVLMSGKEARQRNLAPMGRIVGYSHVGVDPAYMGMGPVPAIRQVLQNAGLTLDQMDVIEINEAFAAQTIAVARELDLSYERVNRNGSGVSLGHPVGATGAIITVKAIYELLRTGGRYGLVSMCIGGGQGIAMIIERV